MFFLKKKNTLEVWSPSLSTGVNIGTGEVDPWHTGISVRERMCDVCVHVCVCTGMYVNMFRSQKGFIFVFVHWIGLLHHIGTLLVGVSLWAWPPAGHSNGRHLLT